MANCPPSTAQPSFVVIRSFGFAVMGWSFIVIKSFGFAVI